MPILREHLRASRLLLGHSNKLVHQLMDEACKKYPGIMHRTWGHDLDDVSLIGRLLGKDAEDEAFLHLLMDDGYVNKEDYQFLLKSKHVALSSPISQ